MPPNSQRRLSQNQFIGLKVDLPLTYLEGASYIAVDTGEFYIYNRAELPVYVGGTGGGDMLKSVYDPNTKESDAFNMANMDESASNKIFTSAERTLLAKIEEVSNPAGIGNKISAVSPLTGFEAKTDSNGHTGFKAQNTSTGTSAVASFIATISATDYLRVGSLQMNGDNYFRAQLAGKCLLYSTDNIAVVTNNNKSFNFYSTPDFITFTERFNFGISGSWIESKVTADTSTIIDLGFNIGDGNLCNMASANATTTYTLTNSRTGGRAKVLINTSSQPAITGATLVNGDTWITGTDMYMNVFNNGNVVQYKFEKIAP